MNKLLMTLLMVTSLMHGQDIIDTNKFNETSGIVVIEFTEDWNEKNQCHWIKDLSDAQVFRMNLSSELAKKMKVKSIPTVVIFKDTEFIQIFEADISFSLPKNTKDNVQNTINNL